MQDRYNRFRVYKPVNDTNNLCFCISKYSQSIKYLDNVTETVVSVSIGNHADTSLISSNPVEVSMIEKCSGIKCNKTVLATVNSMTAVVLSDFGHIQTHRIGFKWPNLSTQLTFDLLDIEVCS